MGLLSFLFGRSAKPSMDDNIRALLERARRGGQVRDRVHVLDFNYAHGDFQHHHVTRSRPRTIRRCSSRCAGTSRRPMAWVTPDQVREACKGARQSTAVAREYVKALHGRGFTNAMVGVAGSAVDVLLFADLEPASAEKTLGGLLQLPRTC